MTADVGEVSVAERRARTRVSAVLLAAGTALFWVSLGLPAVTLRRFGSTMGIDGWTAATHYGPTGPGNAFLAIAFVAWGLAVWFRSAWAWWIGVGTSCVATVHHGAIGVWPGFEEIRRLHSGYGAWMAATALVCLAFLVLPPPERPPPGESLSREDVRRGREGFAAIAAFVAVAALVAGHFLLPTVIATVRVYGAQAEATDPDAFTYQVGPFQSVVTPSRLEVSTESGGVVSIPVVDRPAASPVAAAQFLAARTGAVEFAALVLPLVLVAAWSSRRAIWRWSGAAIAAAVAVMLAGWIRTPWNLSGFDPHPLSILWYGTPVAFLAAFLLLPPAAGRTPQTR